MGLYYPGFTEAKNAILQESDIDALLSTIDGLYGRDNISDESDIEKVRQEALAQVRRDFTDTSSTEYDQVQFWTKVAQVQRY